MADVIGLPPCGQQRLARLLKICLPGPAGASEHHFQDKLPGRIPKQFFSCYGSFKGQEKLKLVPLDLSSRGVLMVPVECRHRGAQKHPRRSLSEKLKARPFLLMALLSRLRAASLR